MIDCNNLPFILASDPEQNPSDLVPSPNMEELILYARYRSLFNGGHLIEMVKNRALRGVKPLSVTLVHLGDRRQKDEVFEFRRYGTHVEYRVFGTAPAWDDVSGVSCCESE